MCKLIEGDTVGHRLRGMMSGLAQTRHVNRDKNQAPYSSLLSKNALRKNLKSVFCAVMLGPFVSPVIKTKTIVFMYIVNA
jgi:hypothetical protein